MISDRKSSMLAEETLLRARGVNLIAGIDEAGRGPLAGPVVAAAVIFPPGVFLPAVDDSKKVPPALREELYDTILAAASAVGVGIVDNDLIDEINILNATFLAMDRAVASMDLRPRHLLIDGNRFRPGEATAAIPFTTIVGGDRTTFAIAAASIVAKVTRDRLMVMFDDQYPGFGFARHKGYGTPEHRAAIARNGYCPIHRKSFALHVSEDVEG
jgi:ribonuclease HII